MLKLRRFVIVFLVSIMCLVIAPFHVYADTISSSNIVGVNVSVVDYDVVGDNVFNSDYPKSSFILKFELVLDKEYLGYLTGKFTCSIFGHDSQGQQLQINVDSGNKSFYVCGQTLTYYVEQKLYFSNTPTSTYVNIYTPSFTLAGSNVVEFGLLESLEDIQRAIETMDFHTEQITQYLYDSTNGSILEQVVTTNQLLIDAGQMFYNVMVTTDNINNYVIDLYEYISEFRQYNFPIESLYSIYNCYLLGNVEIVDIFRLGSWSYPVFQLKSDATSNYILKVYGDPAYRHTFIIGILDNVSSQSNMLNFVLSSNGSLSVLNTVHGGSYGFRMSTIRFNYSQNGETYLATRQGVRFIIVGLSNSQGVYNNVSTSFAETFGLIDNAPSQNLDNSTDDMQTQFNDMFDYEDDFNSDMNNALQNINVNFDVGNQLGSKFLASADWVRQQYNTLTSNTPFGTVLSFSLLLGLALLIIGKAVR